MTKAQLAVSSLVLVGFLVLGGVVAATTLFHLGFEVPGDIWARNAPSPVRGDRTEHADHRAWLAGAPRVRGVRTAFQPGRTHTLDTHLYTLDVETIVLEPFATNGGAIESVGDRLLVVTPRGRLVTIDRDGKITYLEGGVPLNEPGFLANAMQDNPDSAPITYRVLDILVRKTVDGSRDLFVTHHFLDDGCFVVRLSATTLRWINGRLEVSPRWRTVFDAKPCLMPQLKGNETGGRLPPFKGSEAGGRMLVDGPDHLLVTIGQHGQYLGGARAPPQDPAQHLGKVLRVELATGVAEIYTLGHRNPQGLVRDGDGDIWVTEHGWIGGDELNLLKRGGNYGWPEVSYGLGGDKDGMTLRPDETRPGHHDGFVAPAFAWVPGIGISAIIANDVTAFPLWQDDLLIASLAGLGAGYSLFRVRRLAQQVKYVERIYIGYRIRDMVHGSDGVLALLVDHSRVFLLRRSNIWCGIARPGHVHAAHCASTALGDADGR